MKLGITGTRNGMTEPQVESFLQFLRDNPKFTMLLHGSCRGVDVRSAQLFRSVNPKGFITALPGPEDDPNREVSGVDDAALPGNSHFARNRDIVNECDSLVVIPMDMERQDRGGTWYTEGFARKIGKPVTIIWPDGRMESC